MGTPIVIHFKVGQRFGKWEVIELDLYTPPGPNSWPKRAVRARCECGTERVVAIYHLRYGHTSSCGCAQQTGQHKYMSRWLQGLKQTFNVPKRYCVKTLLEEIGERPSPEHRLALRRVGKRVRKGDIIWCLGRPDNIGGKIYAVRGQWMSIKYGAAQLGVSYQAVKYRLRSGWDVERAFTTPKGG